MSNHRRRRGLFRQAIRPEFRPRDAGQVLGIGLVAGLVDPGLVSGAAGVSQRATRTVIGFLDFYSGVFTLVLLSLAVMGGVLAMDRIVLQPRHRLQLQVMHRAVALASVGFLVLHVLLQVYRGNVRPIDAGIPFLAEGRTLVIGLGTVAAQLMILLAATGIVRGRFAYRSRPALWRAIHATAYLCWPIALLHGLQAGRSPKPWVTVSYDVCVALILVALLVRVITTRRRKARVKKLGPVGKGRVPRQAARQGQPAAAPAVTGSAMPVAALEQRPGEVIEGQAEPFATAGRSVPVSRHRRTGRVGRH